MATFLPLAFGPLGMQELLIIAFIALLFFGNRLPSVMRSMGQGVTEFKKGLSGSDDERLEDRRSDADAKTP